MLASLIPVFDSNMMVRAYAVETQRENELRNISLKGTGELDAASNILGIELVNILGSEAFKSSQKVFIKINNVSVFTEIEKICKFPAQKMVLVIDPAIKPESRYIERIEELGNLGYRFAASGFSKHDLDVYADIISLMDYIIIDSTEKGTGSFSGVLDKKYPNLRVLVAGIKDRETFDRYSRTEICDFFMGPFFTVPIEKGKKKIEPVKITYLELINYVNKPDFDIQGAADVISHDPALVISLLKAANVRARNSQITSVRNAAAMLGQKDLRAWVRTTITKELCSDRPSELARISLLRAKFAENIAPLFELGALKDELFLMGLFSVMDIILEIPMKEVFEKLKVSDDIKDVLLNHSGKLLEIYDFMIAYEKADFPFVDKELLVRDIEDDTIYEAFLDALRWFASVYE